MPEQPNRGAIITGRQQTRDGPAPGRAVIRGGIRRKERKWQASKRRPGPREAGPLGLCRRPRPNARHWSRSTKGRNGPWQAIGIRLPAEPAASRGTGSRDGMACLLCYDSTRFPGLGRMHAPGLDMSEPACHGRCDDSRCQGGTRHSARAALVNSVPIGTTTRSTINAAILKSLGILPPRSMRLTYRSSTSAPRARRSCILPGRMKGPGLNLPAIPADGPGRRPGCGRRSPASGTARPAAT